MDDETSDEPSRRKRSDVGYKRPPKEHQFKPGQKPRARKKRPIPRTVSETLAMILREEVRLEFDGTPRWFTNATLLLEMAFQLAEKGNPTLSRALTNYLMATDKSPSPSDQPVILCEPDSDYDGILHYTRKVRI